MNRHMADLPGVGLTSAKISSLAANIAVYIIPSVFAVLLITVAAILVTCIIVLCRSKCKHVIIFEIYSSYFQ